jgi:metal-sulfur cluster biosynthetic enzyme
MPTETILGALSQVIDPELGVNVVDLGLVEEVQEAGASVRVWLGTTSPACPAGPLMRRNAREALLQLPDVDEAEVLPARDLHWSPERLSENAQRQLARQEAVSAGGDLAPLPPLGDRPQPRERTAAVPRRTGEALAWRRLPLLATGILSLVAASWAGLLRIGWPWPIPEPQWIAAHGPLMVCGFLGTLIGVERAVGLGRSWAFAAPVASGLGALCLLAALPLRVSAAAMTVGAAGLAAIFASLLRGPRELATLTMGVGAVCWLVGNLLWLSGSAVPPLVPWWMAFLVLTIAGERLELSRFLAPPAGAMRTFAACVLALLAGCVLSLLRIDWGARLVGLGLLLVTAWLARHDVARRTVRQSGLTRFSAVCLLSAYFWLGVCGLLGIGFGFLAAGPIYDAFLHALFVGFVLSMVFGHAPIIFPSVLNRPLVYRRAFYLHLTLLHAGLVVRLVGDLAGANPLRQWGGLLNAAAIGLFLVNTVRSIRIDGAPD